MIQTTGQSGDKKTNEVKKHSVTLIIILSLTALATTIGLITFIVTKKFPCKYCFEYPDWWTYFYPVKQLIAIASIVLIWTWRKIGVYGLIVFGLINLVTLVLFELNIIQGIATIVGIGIVISSVKGQWKNYK